MRLHPMCLALCCAIIIPNAAAIADDDEKGRLAELDAYWAEVSRTVREGDFQGYADTCHKQGVLVAGAWGKCHPLSKALARWKKEFDDTKAGTRKSSVSFRFSQRLGDASTAHETGIFLYTWTDAEGKTTREYIHFESLLLKQNGAWKIMMEHQRSRATAEQWDALK